MPLKTFYVNKLCNFRDVIVLHGHDDTYAAALKVNLFLKRMFPKTTFRVFSGQQGTEKPIN